MYLVVQAMTDDLARQAAEVVSVPDGSPARPLRRLTELVARRVTGCTGASAALWEPDEVVAMAASLPELAALADRQFAVGDGPIIAALRGGEPSVTADTLHEDRWPDFGAAAVAVGVRSSATVVHESGSMSVTLSLYGVRTKAFDLEDVPLTSLLAAYGTAMVASAAEYGSVRRTAAQLEEAIRSRAVVDQAKGVLLQAMGCDPDEAFDRLRHISQTEHVKLTEIARRVIETSAEQDPA